MANIFTTEKTSQKPKIWIWFRWIKHEPAHKEMPTSASAAWMPCHPPHSLAPSFIHKYPLTFRNRPPPLSPNPNPHPVCLWVRLADSGSCRGCRGEPQSPSGLSYCHSLIAASISFLSTRPQHTTGNLTPRRAILSIFFFSIKRILIWF